MQRTAAAAVAVVIDAEHVSIQSVNTVRIPYLQLARSACEASGHLARLFFGILSIYLCSFASNIAALPREERRPTKNC